MLTTVPDAGALSVDMSMIGWSPAASSLSVSGTWARPPATWPLISADWTLTTEPVLMNVTSASGFRPTFLRATRLAMSKVAPGLVIAIDWPFRSVGFWIVAGDSIKYG